MAGLFFPWVRTSQGSAAGMGQGDGLPVLALAAGAFFLARARIRWAWIPAALGAIVTGRDLLRLREIEGASAGVGLWMTAVGLAVAAAWLFLREIGAVRAARGR